MKKRGYLSEMSWFFDKANHTKRDKIEIFLRYKLPYFVKNAHKITYQKIKYHMIGFLIRYVSNTYYSMNLFDGITKRHILKGSSNLLLYRGGRGYSYIRRYKATLYPSLDVAVSSLQALQDEDKT